MNILHLTHTSINSDSRILKEMNSIAKSNLSFSLSGIGLAHTIAGRKTNKNDNFNICDIVLKTRQLTLFPILIRHLMSFIELTFRVLLKCKRLKPNIVHCHDFTVLPIGFLIKFLMGAKLIYDAHELESNTNGTSKIFGKTILFVEKVFWASIDALIVVSPSIEKWYRNNIGDKYSEVVLNSPVIEKKTSDINSQYLREHFRIPDESRIFIYVGGLMHGRGIDLLVEVFKNNELNSSLVFLGYGELSDELKIVAAEYPNIYVHDAVPHERVVSITKSADIGVCLIQNVSLSDYYCLPNKLFEYCFAGIPVLASDFPDISKVVKKYNLGKCSELEAQKIYKAIKEFDSIGELPKIKTEDLYELSWRAQEEKLLKLYDRLINQTKTNKV